METCNQTQGLTLGQRISPQDVEWRALLTVPRRSGPCEVIEVLVKRVPCQRVATYMVLSIITRDRKSGAGHHFECLDSIHMKLRRTQ